MFGRRNSLIELLRSQQSETRELIRFLHEESMRYQERRDAEWRRRDEERAKLDAEFQEERQKWAEEARQREEEARQREEDLKRFGEENREYNREILLRNEKVYTSVLARLDEMGKEIRESTAQIRSHREESKAQTQALFRLIDRLDESGGAAAA